MNVAQFRQTFDQGIEAGFGDYTEATYRFNRELPKPCVHPLVTPAGAELSGFEMSDHVWHRGLWFAIKFVNGSNFWEENGPHGVQQSRGQPRCEILTAGAMRVIHDVDWISEATDLVIRETRTLTFRAAASDTRVIDWSTELLTTKDLALDRTPYTTWGGYGGLSFRASRALHDVSFETPNGEVVQGLAGQPHPWIVMNSAVDGGVGKRVSMGVVDHPSNPRSPTPWYCKTGNGFTYWNAAFLFHESMTLREGRSLKLRYRVAYRDDIWATGEFAAIADAFRNETAEKVSAQ